MVVEARAPNSITLREDQALVGIPIEQHGQQVVCYAAEDDAAADQTVTQEAITHALAAIGSWSDLDWDEMEQALDRIRHESRPTPPIDVKR